MLVKYFLYEHFSIKKVFEAVQKNGLKVISVNPLQITSNKF